MKISAHYSCLPLMCVTFSVLATPLVTGNVYRDVGLVLPWLQNEMGLYLSYLLFIWAATQENLSGVSARLNSDGLAT